MKTAIIIFLLSLLSSQLTFSQVRGSGRGQILAPRGNPHSQHGQGSSGGIDIQFGKSDHFKHPNIAPRGLQKHLVRDRNNIHESAAAEITNEAVENMRCENLTKTIQLITSRIMTIASIVSNPNATITNSGGKVSLPGPKLEFYKKMLNSKEFWNHLWAQITNIYKQCDMSCFNDGVTIGQLSGTGYCSAAVALGGLDSPGLQTQSPLPLCESQIYVGCQKGYWDAAAQYDGCSQYTQNSYLATFTESQSLDCHID